MEKTIAEHHQTRKRPQPRLPGERHRKYGGNHGYSGAGGEVEESLKFFDNKSRQKGFKQTERNGCKQYFIR